MKRNRLLLLLALLLTAATGAWAQEQWDVVWDFTAWSTETVTALKADAAASKLEGWSDVEKQADAEAGADPTEAAKDNCFWFAGTVNEDGSLSANGAVIKELKGLKFNSDYAAKRSLAIAVNYPSTSLGDYAGGAYLWLGGSKQTCFTIPGVKAGSKITIEVESNKTSSARGIGLYKNSYAAENLIGEQFTPTAKEAKTWDITEDCDVVVYNTSSCHIYTIKVKAPAGDTKYTVSMKDGVKDADKWTITPNPAEEGQTVTLQYNGRLKVKGVKATSDAPAAKPAATVTTAPTGAAIVGRLNTNSTALVSGGVADGGTLMYAVTTTNTKPTSTAGFSDAVPTAETITASGKVYVWYYVKGDDTHSDSEIAATAIEVPVADIVWDVTNVSDLEIYGNEQSVKEGVTLSGNAVAIEAVWSVSGIAFNVHESGGFTFTAPAGKAFTKIEMNAEGSYDWDEANLGTGWAYNNLTVTWTGSAASTVNLLKDTDYFEGSYVKSIAFYLSE